MISARIQKQLNGELNISKKKLQFEPVNSSFKYDKNTLELRKVYKNVCVHSRHSLQYDDAVAMSKTEEGFFNMKRNSKVASRVRNRSKNSTQIFGPGVSRYSGADLMQSHL